MDLLSGDITLGCIICYLNNKKTHKPMFKSCFLTCCPQKRKKNNTNISLHSKYDLLSGGKDVKNSILYLFVPVKKQYWIMHYSVWTISERELGLAPRQSCLINTSHLWLLPSGDLTSQSSSVLSPLPWSLVIDRELTLLPLPWVKCKFSVSFSHSFLPRVCIYSVF